MPRRAGRWRCRSRQRWRLLATFNSGFMNRDSHGGFYVDGHSAAPLRPGQGTIVAYRNGRVDVFTWHGGAIPGPTAVLARQNLPLIVDHGRPNPLLKDSSLWGSTLGNAVRVWRSGAGIDRHGNLIYLAAEDQTAASLAVALIHAGAVRADRVGHQRRVAEPHHLRARRRRQCNEGRPERPAVDQSLSRSRRPRLLRDLPENDGSGSAERSLWLSQPERRARWINRSSGAQKMRRAIASERWAES